MAFQRKKIDGDGALVSESRETTKANKQEEPGDSFFFVRSDSGNPFSYLLGLCKHGGLTHTTAPTHVVDKMNSNTTSWQQRLSVLAIHVLLFVQKPVALLGRIVELLGNTYVANGGFLKTLVRLPLSALFLFQKGPLVIPGEETADYRTLIGLLDPRDTLLSTPAPSITTGGSEDVAAENSIFPVPDNGAKKILDLMILAAKLIYENEALITKVVTNNWQMNLVGIYNCWNDYQQRSSKLVFIFTDKKEDADAVVVVWRGTEPFSTQDWATDIDFSWYDLKKGVGRVHVGFFEALGLGVRTDSATLKRMRKKRCPAAGDDPNNKTKPPMPGPCATGAPASGLPGDVIDDPDKILAYDNTTNIVKELLLKNPRAKLYITGHSLGGALTLLYGSLLHFFGEDTITARLGALYTFGQPRVGDTDFATYTFDKIHLGQMYRIVYCNDIVPRVPFDDPLFQFRHYGMCFYFDRHFATQTLKDAPNKNFFSIKDTFFLHWNALCELVDAFWRHKKYGPEYKESAASVAFRVLGLIVPGFASHSPVNYVNALRLSKDLPLVEEISTLELS